VNHVATPDFWRCYRALPPAIRELANKNFALLKQDLSHPSIRFKQIGNLWSARVGLRYRALARHRAEGFVWFWIGPHGEYDKILSTKAP
jgi:hypothetical protein